MQLARNQSNFIFWPGLQLSSNFPIIFISQSLKWPNQQSKTQTLFINY